MLTFNAFLQEYYDFFCREKAAKKWKPLASTTKTVRLPNPSVTESKNWLVLKLMSC